MNSMWKTMYGKNNALKIIFEIYFNIILIWYHQFEITRIEWIEIVLALFMTKRNDQKNWNATQVKINTIHMQKNAN